MTKKPKQFKKGRRVLSAPRSRHRQKLKQIRAGIHRDYASDSPGRLRLIFDRRVTKVTPRIGEEACHAAAGAENGRHHGDANKSGMNLLFPLQHCNKLLNLPTASLHFFHRLNSPKDGIPVRPVKSLEKFCGPRIRVQRSLKVARHGCSAGRVICGIPSSILFGILDRLQPSGLHLPARNQRQRFLPVDLRPDALARA